MDTVDYPFTVMILPGTGKKYVVFKTSILFLKLPNLQLQPQCMNHNLWGAEEANRDAT